MELDKELTLANKIHIGIVTLLVISFSAALLYGSTVHPEMFS